MKMFLPIPRFIRQALRLAGLGLTVFVAAAPVYVSKDVPALSREELTSKLVPVTGESQRSVDLTVPFARDSAKLTATAREQLDELGAALAGERLKPLDVGVYGHTDASGKAAYNQQLSEKRAAAVVGYLVRGFSLERKRFRHAGHGEERLLEGIAANSPRHRRVEIVVVAPEPKRTPETPTVTEAHRTAEPPGVPLLPGTESAWPEGKDQPAPSAEKESGSGVQVVQ